jgi:hypothetical protein
VQLSLAAEAIGWLRARRYPTWFRFLQARCHKKIGRFEQYTVRQRVAKRYHAFGLDNSCQVYERYITEKETERGRCGADFVQSWTWTPKVVIKLEIRNENVFIISQIVKAGGNFSPM